MAGVFLIPEEAEFLDFHEARWPISARHPIEHPIFAPDPVVEPTPAAEVSPSQPAVESVDSIWNEPGVGYNCAATDAWVDDPSHCTAANLGGDSAYDLYWGPGAALPAEEMRDLSTVPGGEGGTCPAAVCGYGTDEAGNDRNQIRQEPHPWWAECITTNTAEYCRAHDPYVN